MKCICQEFKVIPVGEGKSFDLTDLKKIDDKIFEFENSQLTKEEKELIGAGLVALPVAALMSIKSDGTLDEKLQEEMKGWTALVQSIKQKLSL